MALKQIKSKIKATERTSKVTKAMEAVSAVKMRKSQERAFQGRPFAESALRILENVSRSAEVRQHAFVQESVGSHECLIVITSDKGLAGSLNSAVLKEATIAVQNLPRENLEVICFGKKAYEHFLRRGYTIPKHYVQVSDEIRIQDVEEVVALITARFTTGMYKRVRIVYQQFASTFEQKATIRQVLPISQEAVRAMIHDILPKQGKFSETARTQSSVAYNTEQSSESLYDAMFSMLVEIMVYHALLESKASEHSARMVAMKNATDKAKEVTKALTLLYNKKRQSVITAEVSEITGGIEALKNA